jgi:hypothetical protein
LYLTPRLRLWKYTSIPLMLFMACTGTNLLKSVYLWDMIYHSMSLYWSRTCCFIQFVVILQTVILMSNKVFRRTTNFNTLYSLLLINLFLIFFGYKFEI